MTQKQIAIFKAQAYYNDFVDNFNNMPRICPVQGTTSLEDFLEGVSVEDVLSHAFSWVESPQGVEYWNRKDTAWVDAMTEREKLSNIFKAQVWYEDWERNFTLQRPGSSLERFFEDVTPGEWLKAAFRWNDVPEEASYWYHVDDVWQNYLKKYR